MTSFRACATGLAGALLLGAVAACTGSPESVTEISADDLAARKETLVLLDVRTPQEFTAGHLPQAWNVPLDEVWARMKEIRAKAGPRDLVVYCQGGRRAGSAAAALSAEGLHVMHLTGDYGGWLSEKRPVEVGAPGTT